MNHNMVLWAWGQLWSHWSLVVGFMLVLLIFGLHCLMILKNSKHTQVLQGSSFLVPLWYDAFFYFVYFLLCSFLNNIYFMMDLCFNVYQNKVVFKKNDIFNARFVERMQSHLQKFPSVKNMRTTNLVLLFLLFYFYIFLFYLNYYLIFKFFWTGFLSNSLEGTLLFSGFWFEKSQDGSYWQWQKQDRPCEIYWQFGNYFRFFLSFNNLLL